MPHSVRVGDWTLKQNWDENAACACAGDVSMINFAPLFKDSSIFDTTAKIMAATVKSEKKKKMKCAAVVDTPAASSSSLSRRTRAKRKVESAVPPKEEISCTGSTLVECDEAPKKRKRKTAFTPRPPAIKQPEVDAV